MKNNKNNKGFTMVELIIVIAILAILMVALVPQFIKYVESAKQSNDNQVVATLESAVEVALVDPTTDANIADNITVTWVADATGTISVATPTTGYTTFPTLISDAMGGTAFPVKSSLYKGRTYTVTVDTTTGVVTGAWSAATTTP